jgi:hypothetical protein
VRWFLAFIQRIIDKFIGPAPSWYNDPKVAYSKSDLLRIEKLEEERKRRGL